jgi:hypothetical protein
VGNPIPGTFLINPRRKMVDLNRCLKNYFFFWCYMSLPSIESNDDQLPTAFCTWTWAPWASRCSRFNRKLSDQICIPCILTTCVFQTWTRYLAWPVPGLWNIKLCSVTPTKENKYVYPFRIISTTLELTNLCWLHIAKELLAILLIKNTFTYDPSLHLLQWLKSYPMKKE